MANNPATSEFTSFTLDNMGRSLCNTAHEALRSAGFDVGIGNPPLESRPFDVIIIGGGTFGSVIAQHLFFNDKTRSRRILVIERGPFVLPEHVQNLPFQGGLPDFVRPWEKTFSGDNPGLRICLGGRSLEWGGWSPELLKEELPDWPLSVVDAMTKPVLIQGQPAPDPGYFQQSAEQIGSADTNDFVYGPLHTALRSQLANGLKASAASTVISNLPLASWPDHPRVRYTGPLSDAALRELLQLNATAPVLTAAEMKDLLKVEAPLAVQSRTDPGQFPINKFSALPLLISATRTSSNESYPYDQFKRLMTVPSWHVQELITQTLPSNEVKVTAVRIVRGSNNTVAETMDMPLADNGVVILSQGVIESTRLAMQTFKDSLAGRAAQRMGKNLMVHLRSNLTIRVPRSSIKNLPIAPKFMQVSTLFVKGKAKIAGRDRYFHLQITASGLTATGADSEAELFKKIPDLDNIEKLKRSDDTTVVITVRGIGEMTPHNPDSSVSIPGQGQDFNRPRAVVSVGDAKLYAEALAAGQPLPAASNETKHDAELWEKMDQLADEVALIFGDGKAFQILGNAGSVITVGAATAAAQLKTLHPYVNRRDGVGTTHHESGTLWMGDAIATSVSDGFGRIHDTINCFSAGPMLFPTGGSPNPMLTGVALARRTADYLSYRLTGTAPSNLLSSPKPFVGDGAGWQVLFDGTLESFNKWSLIRASSGANNEPPCGFRYIDGQMVSVGAGDFGILWYEPEAFSNFTLKLQFRVFDAQVNSGVFIRIRDPRKPLPEPIKSRAQKDLDAFKNLAWTAVHSGFEVQIDDTARADPRVDFFGQPEPPHLNKNRTGAIYKIPAGDMIPGTSTPDIQNQTYQAGPALIPRPWNDPSGWYEFEIKVKDSEYEVWLGAAGAPKIRTSLFINLDPARGVPASMDTLSGFIGLQAYSGYRVAFRNIQIKKQ